MRLGLSLSLLMLLTAGCTGTQSTGALWAQQNLDEERAMFQLGDARRAQQAQSYELSLADEELQSEQQRVSTWLQTCPGATQPLQVSPGDKVRDAVRVQIQQDTTRTAELARIALADWYIRRAAATGDPTQCERAQAALAGSGSGTPPTTDILQGIPSITVLRAASDVAQASSAAPAIVTVTVSNYALGYLDAVQAAAPLPQYLAGVYGGVLLNTPPTDNADTAAALVDAQAPNYPQWEPDALYLALRGGAMP